MVGSSRELGCRHVHERVLGRVASEDQGTAVDPYGLAIELGAPARIDFDPAADCRIFGRAADMQAAPVRAQIGHVVADANAVLGRDGQIEIDPVGQGLFGAGSVLRSKEEREHLAIQVDVADEHSALDVERAIEPQPPLVGERKRNVKGEHAIHPGGQTVVEPIGDVGQIEAHQRTFLHRPRAEGERSAVQTGVAARLPGLPGPGADHVRSFDAGCRSGPPERGFGAARRERGCKLVGRAVRRG